MFHCQRVYTHSYSLVYSPESLQCHPKAKPYSNHHPFKLWAPRLHRSNEVMARLEVQHTSCTTGICQGSKQIILPGSDVLLMRGDQIRDLLPGRFSNFRKMLPEKQSDHLYKRNIETHIFLYVSLSQASDYKTRAFIVSSLSLQHILQLWKETY